MPIFKPAPEMLLGDLPPVSQGKLPDGKKGNLRTIKVMKKVAHERKGHPLVRNLALNILKSENVESNQFLDESRVIGEFVQEHVRYVRDTFGIEQLHDPVLMIKNIQKGTAQGDCDDMSLLIVTLLLSIGHYPKFRAVRYGSFFGPYNHIYVVDYDRNGRTPLKRLSIDAIVKDRPIGFEVKHTSGREYPV